MNADDFNAYLKTKLPSTIVSNEQNVEQTEMNNEEDKMIGDLKDLYAEIIKTETLILKKYMLFGEHLIGFKEYYIRLKIQKLCKERWPEWLLTKTNIKVDSVKQYIGLAEAARIWPKLKELDISFTHMRKILPKIKKTFIVNPNIGEQWR